MSPTSAAKQPGSRAFTLVELTLAVLILAVLTAVGIPSFKSLWAKTEMQRVATEFTGALRYAQQRAVMERKPIRVVVDVDEERFWVPIEQEEERRVYKTRRSRNSSRASSLRSSRRNARKEYVKEIQGKLPEGFIFEFVYKVASDDEIRRGEGEFTFFPDGSADSAYFTVLRLAKTREEERRIFIKLNPATGSVKMLEGRTEDEGSDFYRGLYDDPGFQS